MTTPDDVLEFWFAGDVSTPRTVWFEKDAGFDEACGHFADTLRRARNNELDDWAQTPRGTLALLIVLDQFPRNLHRGSPESYAADAQARAVARTALADGFDQQVGPVERLFFYLPFSHSEDLADQQLAVHLTEALDEEDGRYARHHRDVIRRFGRFPHRNEILGRITTPEEAAWLPTDTDWSQPVLNAVQPTHIAPGRDRTPGLRYEAAKGDYADVNKPLGANSLRNGPDSRGRFGEFGGRFVAETLMPLILEVEQAYLAARADPAFQTELDAYLKNYVGRPSPLWFAERLTRHLNGAKIYFKRDELNHTGSHKANNCMGQILLARRMGKTRIIAETGAGQHGVATATMCALFGLPCTVYMGATDVERQAPNVFRMKLLGAEVKPVTSGASTLKDAMNEALRDWVANVEDTYYLIGTVAGPHPYPTMVRDFQSVIGEEAKAQLQEAESRLPDAAVACIGGGSNAMGLFHPFLDDPSVRLIGVEAGGHGIESGEHAASLTGGRPGVLHGNRTYLLQDDDGQIIEAHSISAGLDYPGIGPEHSWLHDIGRVEYVSATDEEALAAFQLCTRTEGIIPALEPAHALAHVTKLAPTLEREQIILMNLCGRGDKDIFTVAEHLGVKL